MKSRPDGLLVVSSGKNTWTALIEAKIGKAEIDASQVQKYLELARENKIDAVVTISNEFVARADHSPVSIPKTLLRKVSLFHWSWSWIATQCEIIRYKKEITDSEQSYLLKHLNYFFSHPATGIERFSQMNARWKDVVQSVTNDEALKKTAPEVEETVASWFSEERDLGLHLASHVGREVEAQIERKFVANHADRLKQGIADLVEHNTLTSKFRVPDCAADIVVCADVARRTIAVSMMLKAPTDRKSTKARVKWILRMLKMDDPRLLLRAHWPGRAAPTTKEVSALRCEPSLLQTDNPNSAPHGFEVLIVERTGKRFGGRRTFIEDIERIVPEFYDIVGAKLKAWQAPPPQPVKTRDDFSAEDTTPTVTQED